jgi:hypothetical protein
VSDWLAESESISLLGGLFPHGLCGRDLMEGLCPDGWRASPLRLAFHPTPEQQWEEAVAWRKNLERLDELFEGRRKTSGTEEASRRREPLPDRTAFLARARQADDAGAEESDAKELGRLTGLCLWDILSDNHDLILPDGRIRHMGSFRATAGIIADFFRMGPEWTRDPEASEFAEDIGSLNWNMDYCEFYMGTWAVARRTDLRPVHRLIFQRLAAHGCDWRYAFPRLGVVKFEKPEDEDGEAGWANYDPSVAFAAAQEKAERDAEFERMQEELDEAHRGALEEAKSRPAPATVQAYHSVFGHWPPGWPPWEK